MADIDFDIGEFFASRRGVLEERIKELDRQIQRLQAERASAQVDLEKTIKAMQIMGDSPASIGERPKLTIKQGVLRVLEAAPDGLSALGILERLRVDLDMNYERTSLSPQLSRLKREGKIELEGGIWKLSR